MARALDRTLQEIAAWLEQAGSVDPSLVSRLGGAISTLRMPLEPTGSDAEPDAAALDYLLGLGRVDRADSAAFLAQLYPERRFQRDTWADQERLTNEAAAADMFLAGGATRAELAALAVGAAITQARAGEESALAPTALPEEYDRGSIESALRRMAAQIRTEIEDLRSLKRVRFPTASVPGQAVAPGSLPFSALNPVEAHEALGRVAGPEQTIDLAVGGAAMDQFLADGAATGPGRIRRARATRPPDWKPHAGPQRYRVLQPDTPFGVMWLEFRTDSWTSSPPAFLDFCDVHYGMVLTGIPHTLGRIPTQVRLASYGLEAPSSLAYLFEDAGFPAAWSGADRLWENRAEAEYHTQAKPAWSIMGAAGPLTPTQAVLDRIHGVSVALITGTTAEAVWQQLNTRQSVAGGMIERGGLAPGVTLPGGIELSVPCGASVITWNGATGGAERYTHQAKGYNLNTEPRLVQGVPFLFEDCERLRASEREFSLVIQPVVSRSFAVAGTWPSPAHWAQIGLRTPRATRRKWAVDIVIE
jgi:hypothetical protein